MKKKLIQLADNYKSSNTNRDWSKDLNSLYEQYVKGKEQTLIDAAAATAAINALFLADQINLSSITPQMEEAFYLAFPNHDLSALPNYSQEELSGLLSGWKGKYFEVLVRDDLNSGQFVGDIYLQSGQYAEIAENVNQPGWDLQILNDDGTIANELQLKATESLGYVQSALEKYPDIDVLTTSEVFQNSDILTDQIINSGVSDDALTTQIFSPMENLFDSPFTNIMENVLPGLPFLIITISESRNVLIGRKSFDLAIANGLERAAKTGLAMGVGGLVYLLDGGILSLPASFLTRIGFDRFRVTQRVSKDYSQKQLSMNQILLNYKSNH